MTVDSPLLPGMFSVHTCCMPFELLPAVEINPPGNPQASIIWLHGLGADGHDFEPLIPQLDIVERFGVRVVLPHAPELPVTINNGMRMPAWYDIASMDFRKRQDRAGIEASARRVVALIEAEVARGVPARRILLAGFSQGGAMVLHVGLRYTESLCGLLALSAYLPLADTLSAEASDANRGVPIMMAHGTQDPVVPVGLGEASRELLRSAGYAVDWHSYPMQHAVCAEEIDDIREWLSARLAAAEDI